MAAVLDDADFLGAGTLNIAGTPTNPITVTLSTLAGAGALDTVNISDANTTLNGAAGVSALTNVNIGSGGSLDLASTTDLTPGLTVTFTAPDGSLAVGSGVDLSPLSSIAGFSGSNTIDLGQPATTASYTDNPGSNTGGTLSLMDANGNTVATLPFSTGDFTTGSFVLQSDGNGGTTIGLRPTVTGVTTNPSSGDVVAGQPVTLTVTTSKPVTVAGGTPTLSLNDGGVATYDPALSTPGALAFTYMPAAGDSTPDLGITGASLNGATITDSSGNPVDLSGAAVDPAGTLTVGTATSPNPFATLSVSNNDPTTMVTVMATLTPAISGTYGNPGTGSFGADGMTYTVSGTAAQVNAALAGVTFTPAPGRADGDGGGGQRLGRQRGGADDAGG